MKKNILFLLCVALGTFAIQVQAQFTVNFQYTNSAGGGVGVPALYTGTGVPGVGTGTFWNTVPGPASSQSLGVGDPHSTSQSSFADDGVTDTKIKWTLTTKGNYNRKPIVGLSLLNSYAICKPSSGSIPFYFTNVPSGTYNVVLFSLGGANTGSGTSFTINGLTLTNKEPGNKSTAFIMYTNFVVFSNVVVTTEGAINGTWQSSSSANTIDAHFNGAQLQRVSAITAYAFQPSIAPTNSVFDGTLVTITANAVGVAPVFYQWQTDGGGATFTNVSGATNNPLNLNTTGLFGTNNYQVIVSDASGSSTSAPVALTVNPQTPLIATLPAATAITNGQTLASSSLSGGTATNAAGESVGGSFAFTTPSLEPTNVGSTNVSVTFTPTDAVDYTTASATVSVTVVASTTPTSISVISSLNPSGYLAPVYFTATVQSAATGSVIFLTNNVQFDSETLVSGVATSVTTAWLPRGTNTITAEYAGNSNYLGSTNNLVGGQIVTNHPPMAATMTVTRTAGLGLIIALSDVATNWSDVDSDTVTLAGINLVTTNFVNLTTNGAYIFYTNSPNVNDQISYTISDGQGGTNTGLINVVMNPFVTGQNATVSVSNSTATVSFSGIPGYSYSVQRTTNLMSAFVTLETTNAPGNGLFNYTDNFSDLGVPPAPTPSSAYYRLEWNP